MTEVTRSPLVSVVVPVYNCETYIESALRSVLEQSIDDLEIIAVDDASSDGSLAVLERLAAADRRLRVLPSTVNSGQGACRNRAIRAARGRYITFQDADDLWLPGKLERQLEFLRQRELPFCFCGYGTIDERGEVLIDDLRIPAQTDYLSLLKSNTVCTPSVIYDRQKMDDIVMLERPHRREDLVGWLGVAQELGKLQGIPDPLVMVRRIRGSSSSNKLKTLAWQWRVYRDIAGFGRLRAMLYLAIFSVTSLAKRSAGAVRLKRRAR